LAEALILDSEAVNAASDWRERGLRRRRTPKTARSNRGAGPSGCARRQVSIARVRDAPTRAEGPASAQNRRSTVSRSACDETTPPFQPFFLLRCLTRGCATGTNLSRTRREPPKGDSCFKKSSRAARYTFSQRNSVTRRIAAKSSSAVRTVAPIDLADSAMTTSLLRDRCPVCFADTHGWRLQSHR
jgi:hypothetical protein